MLPHHMIAFDEGERILIVSLLGKSLLRVLWTSSSGIGRHFGLAGWLCGTNSLDLTCKCFLGRLELKKPIIFSAQSIK